MILDLSNNIQYSANNELQRIMRKAFVDVILEESKREGENLNKLTNKAVYLLCWLKRYMSQLFSNWKQPDVGCFIYLGGCRNINEALFMSFLARIPTDVLTYRRADILPCLTMMMCFTGTHFVMLQWKPVQVRISYTRMK